MSEQSGLGPTASGPGLDDARHAQLDAGRPEAMRKQAAHGRLSARQRIDRLLDDSGFLEYGMFARPAHADVDGPADGVVTGVGTVAGRPTAVVSFDYTVFGGTMGQVGKAKIDRMIALAGRERYPLVFLAEGGGAHAQDLGITSREGTTMFVELARLSGRVPTVGVVMGPTFAGHANLVGLCDVIVATETSSMGIGGPPMVEAATGIKQRPEEIGPADVHAQVGGIDLLATDDDEALRLTRAYLAFFAGDATTWDEPGDAMAIDTLVPVDPRRAYDVRGVIEAMVDASTMLELRPRFGGAVVTALARLGGVAVAVVASQPRYHAGAFDSAASDKAARFVHLADAFGLPVLFLVDTPGFMVGRTAEEDALVRHSARMVHALATARVPILTVVMRKAYGLGYYALGAPPFDPLLILEWPTAEYGGMGLEGAASILRPPTNDDVDDGEGGRHQLAQDLRREHSPWIAAGRFAVDDLVEPHDTRARLIHALGLLPASARQGSARPIDPW